MKTLTLSLLMSLTLSLMVVGCADNKKVVSAPSTATYDYPYVNINPNGFVPTGTGAGSSPGDNGEWYYGATTALTISGSSSSARNYLLSQYAGHSINSPQNVRVNMNFKKIGSQWGGVVTISYTDTDGYHEGYFTTGGSDAEVSFNVWYRNDGTPVFHAVLEDECYSSAYQTCGGLVIVLDNYLDLGDGGTPNAVGGSIWYKNFTTTYAPHPPTRCWFVGLKNNNPTPYDCRPWPRDDDNPLLRNNTYASVNPTSDSGYVQLGTFSGLDLSQAFNGEFDASTDVP